MQHKHLIIVGTLLTFLIILAACSNNDENRSIDKNNKETSIDSNSNSHMDNMNHSSSSEVPAGLKVAGNPKFPVGTKAIIQTDHMKGMKGAQATIKGAYKTIAYVVTYTPTDGGKPVKNHKWVIHEEIEDAAKDLFKSGSKVKLTASHMKGMKGASAVVDSTTETTVYLIDYTPTNGGERITNHKWVTEDELSAN